MRTTSASRPPATAGNLESVPAPQSRGDCVLQPKATQSHINATSKPPQCVLIANRLRPKPVLLPWGNGGGTVGERWGDLGGKQSIANRLRPQCHLKAWERLEDTRRTRRVRVR